MQFDPVVTTDFTSFKPGHVATHVKIEQLLTKIGGGGTEGAEFKRQILKLAGWKYDPIIGFAKHPETAAQTFNKVRELLSQTEEKNALLSKLGG